MLLSRTRCGSVTLVRCPDHHRPLHHCILGNGQLSRGIVYTWTSLDHSSVTFLVLVDACSKWMDVRLMKSIIATKTIEELRMIFATHGLPQRVVTDNGPTFTSSEFQEFMSRNGIRLIHSAPYHPSTNGLAERAVQSFKQGINPLGAMGIYIRRMNN